MMQTPWTRFNPILSLGAETKLGFLVSDTLMNEVLFALIGQKVKPIKGIRHRLLFI